MSQRTFKRITIASFGQPSKVPSGSTRTGWSEDRGTASGKTVCQNCLRDFDLISPGFPIMQIQHAYHGIQGGGAVAGERL